MTNKQSPKKVVKNIEKPKIQRRNCEVVKHFEPLANYAACRSSLAVEIPLINVNSDEEQTLPKSPVRRQTIFKIPSSNIAKHNRSPSHDEGSKPIHRNEQLRTQTKLKSSSSSSLEIALDTNPNKSKVKSKSYYSNPKSIHTQKLVRSAGERGSVPQSKNECLKSITDPALIQRELNLKSLKQEILENRRATAFERQRPDITQYKPNPQIQTLKAEILQSKTNNMLQKKLLITELRSEIAQYQHFNKYHVYNTYGDELGRKPEIGDTSKPENDNSVRSRAGLKKVSVVDSVSNKNGSVKSDPDSCRNEVSSRGLSGTGTDRESVFDTTEG